MITKRIIPCLDIKDGRVVKGTNFKGLNDVSSPVELAKVYSDCGADELVFYDITASFEGRRLFTDILTQVASQVFIPLTVGGGINTVDDFDRVLKCGADKVSVNSGAIKNPDLIKEAAQQIEKINNDDIQLRNEVKELLSNKSYFKNQPDKLKELRLKTIDSHNTEQLNILKKYLEEIKITDGASLPNSIFDGETISLKCFGDLYHEFGHFLDNVIVDGKRARDVIPKFLDILKKDALEWINHNSPEKTVASLDKIPKDVRSLINDKIRPVFGKSDYFDAADLLDGLTGGKLGGMKVMDGGAHEKGYYDFNETVKHIEGEAIAIFTESWYTPKSGTSRGVLEVFPNAYNLWIDFLRSATNVL